MSAGLVALLAVLVAAKLGAEAAERAGAPAVVGEIVAGVLVGPSALGWVHDTELLADLAELGAILLLLEVGIHLDLAELRSVGRNALVVACAGVVAPLVLGWSAATAAGHGGTVAVFVGAALTATSVGVTARVFGDLRALASTEARTVLGAAVADDVLGLLVLTVVVRLVTGGELHALDVGGVVAVALGFLIAAGAAGLRLAPPLFGRIHGAARGSGTVFGLALGLALGMAALAAAAGLAPIIGAFVAGLALSRTTTRERIQRDLAPFGHVLVPVFFVHIGVEADVSAFARPAVLAVAAALLVAAVAGKLVSPLLLRGAAGDRLAIGLGMLPRGEVGLIFATIGRAEGVLGDDLYAALLLVVLATTLCTPMLLRRRLRSLAGTPRPRTATVVPAGGWLRTTPGVVELVAEPPTRDALHVALAAALAVRDKEPGPALQTWVARLGASLRWDAAAGRELAALLREGNARSWRFLERAAVLERALPELDAALRRRRAAAFDLDGAVLRFDVLERVRSLAGPVGRGCDDALLLAALVLDVGGGDGDLARRLAARLGLGPEGERQSVDLVTGGDGFRRAASSATGFAPSTVAHLAAHLGRPERVWSAWVAAVALDAPGDDGRRRLDQLRDLVLETLETGAVDADIGFVERRRRAAAARLDGAAAERARLAPAAFVATVDVASLARVSALAEPRPHGRAVRVAVLPNDGSWIVDVAAADRPGLFAEVTGVLARHGDVVRADLVTWPDGAAVESFVLDAAEMPDAAALAAEIRHARSGRPVPHPVAEATVSFDDASPWHTRCEVRAPDQPGLLHRLALAFAAAGVDVHAAHAETVAGLAVDRFDVSGRGGGHLDGGARRRVEAAVSGTRSDRVTRSQQSGSRAEIVAP